MDNARIIRADHSAATTGRAIAAIMPAVPLSTR
jgi:hypothetical protein